jgi:hypothetical protein
VRSRKWAHSGCVDQFALALKKSLKSF